jgi:maleate isomerase
VTADADTLAVRASMVDGLNAALDALVPAGPGHVVLGVMAENFVGGGAAGHRLVADCSARIGCRVTDYTSAILAALDAMFGRTIRLALLTPFMPVGDLAARALFEDAGHEVVRLIGLKAPSPAAIARIPRERIKQSVRDLAGPEVEAIIQVGTNAAFRLLAREMEAELGMPVLAANPVLYWRVLRREGIADAMPQHGRLFTL